MQASLAAKRVRLHDTDGSAGALFKRLRETGAEGHVELPYPLEKVSAWSRPEQANSMSVEDVAGALEV